MCLCVCLEGREKEREKAVSNSITDSDGDLCVRTCLVEPGISQTPVGVGGGERVVCSVLSHPVSLAQVDVSDADDTCSSLMSPPSSKAPPPSPVHI